MEDAPFSSESFGRGTGKKVKKEVVHRWKHRSAKSAPLRGATEVLLGHLVVNILMLQVSPGAGNRWYKYLLN